jgi:hypothetical protein
VPNAAGYIVSVCFNSLLVARGAIGERVVSSKEYRDFADECLGWAKTAKSDNERDIFLQMAQVWLEAAMRSEEGPTKVHRARHAVITRLAG